MDLYGWKYTGRKISPEFQRAVLVIDAFFNDPYKVANRTWTPLQKDLGRILEVAPGQIRTLKVLMEEVGILKVGALNMKEVPVPSKIYTKDGQTIVMLLKTQELLRKQLTSQNIRHITRIDETLKMLYLKALSKTIMHDGDDSVHTLRATLKALMRYGTLDKWEWYLLNTIIRNDDNLTEEALLSEKITLYRSGRLTLKDVNIKSQELSHSYILGNFEYTGILKIEKLQKDDRKFLVKPNLDLKKIIDEIIG